MTGYVARRSVQVGQRVAPGTPLMAIVPLDGVWVDANFKEVQLKHMRIGQPVTLTADVYGSSVKYHGQVVGFSAGTGAAFAVLPAQNATGNWIKVVQRLPVRIQLDQKRTERASAAHRSVDAGRSRDARRVGRAARRGGRHLVSHRRVRANTAPMPMRKSRRSSRRTCRQRARLQRRADAKERSAQGGLKRRFASAAFFSAN